MLLTATQRTKKLVDFAVGLVDFILHLPVGKVKDKVLGELF